MLNTDNFIFSLDTLSTRGCTGWYIRKDGICNELICEIDGLIKYATPGKPRPDVRESGFGVLNCGFEISFEGIKNFEEIVIKDYADNILYKGGFKTSQFKKDEINKKLIHVVEPFTQLEMLKVQDAIMEDVIFQKYYNFYKKVLNFKDGQVLRDELTGILAEIKTTIHLLSAAYLDQTRYKDPEFLKSLPNPAWEPDQGIAIDMQGDLTGSNWRPAESNGRWMGPESRSTLLLPNLAKGAYAISLDIQEEGRQGLLDYFTLAVNNQPMPLERIGAEPPCLLKGAFTIASKDDPILFLEFKCALPGNGLKNGKAGTLQAKPDHFYKIREIIIKRGERG